MSKEIKLPIERASDYAERFMKLISPHVIKMEVAGSIRRKQPFVSDVEIVCLNNPDNPLENLFIKGYPGMVKNGSRYKQFKYPQITIDLFIAMPYDYGRILAIRTGSSCFSHLKLATTWNKNGWCGTDEGLRRKKECEKKSNKWVLKEEYKDNPTLPPVFDTEESFFEFLKIDYITPEKRNWVSQKRPEINYLI